jgi:phospholipase C
LPTARKTGREGIRHDRKKRAPLFAAILGLTAALGVLAPNSIGAQPGDRDDHQRHERRKGLDKIKHIVFIVKENRTFDNYFGTFPGADGRYLWTNFDRRSDSVAPCSGHDAS